MYTLEESWKTWREMSENGISKYSTPEIRDLHAAFGMHNSDILLQIAEYDKRHGYLKFLAESKESVLFAEKYNTIKTVTERGKLVLADKEYLDAMQKTEVARSELKSKQLEQQALENIQGVLSRELSIRIKE